MVRGVYELGALSPSLVRIRVPDVSLYLGEPKRSAVVEISVDWNRIAKQLAARAASNVRPVSKAMSGAVVVKVLEGVS